MKRFIPVILIIAMLMTQSAVFASAEEATVEYNSVAHHHFHKLNDNIPENIQGTCAYVAACMLLSFYDSYWSDAFVPSYFEDTYQPTVYSDENYPHDGVPRLKLENAAWDAYERNGGTYANFIYDSSSGESNASQYLHLYLLSIGITLGYYENGANSESFGTTLIELAWILDTYFDLIFGPADYFRLLGNSDSTIPLNIFVKYESADGENRGTVINTIKEQVGSGNPVIYRGETVNASQSNNSNTSDDIYVNDGIERHAMVAYNIKDDGDVDLHLGWTSNGEGSIYTTINNTDFSNDIGVLWIEINEDVLPHNCCNNYRWYSYGSYIDQCSCIAYSRIHPSHTHVFANNAEMCSASNTTTRCTTCNRYVSTHNYTYRSSEFEHWKECACGATTPRELHTRVYSDVTTLSHTWSCDCGYSVTEQHELDNCTMKNASLHLGTCACGRVDSEAHILENIGLGVLKCTKCAYSRKPTEGGGSVHLGIEDDTDQETA